MAERPNASPVKGDPASKSPSDLQHPRVAEDLAFLRKSFRDLIAAYSGQIEGEITEVAELVKSDAQSRKLPASRAHELRDMLSLLRNLDIKPAKGRRRDLKKVETVLEELHRIVERWG
jgi:hypothetical protein